MQMDIQLSTGLKQVLTTEAIFHLEMLQFTNGELASVIAEKALENPLLEIHSLNDRIYYTPSATGYYEKAIMPQQTLEHYLWEMIPTSVNVSPLKKRMINYLIAHLDEHLFLTVAADEVSALFDVKPQMVLECIELLRSLEPFGIACEGSHHFLQRQIEADALAPALALPFIRQELEAMAQLNIPYLMKKYNVPKEQVVSTIHYIKSLKLFPQIPSFYEQTVYIIPDVEISNHFGCWHIEMNEAFLPKVTINEQYLTLMKQQKEYEQYIQSYLKEANLLIAGIEERKKTLYNLMTWLLTKQWNYLTTGQGMIPLRLIDAANDLHVHESTISRAIRNKYVKTPNGIIALKQFFPKGITYSGQATTSSDSIKDRIKSLIAAEDSQKPLSDQDIVSLLQQEQITISRRTVAKYRESLFIPNSSKRAYALK